MSGVELEAETSEVAENGKATCYWKNQTMIDFTRFTETNAASHRTNVSAKSQTINVTCYDSALNMATNITSFTVEQDETGPEIIRIFKDNGLVLRTDEDATCVYNRNANTGCNFNATNWFNAVKFSSTGGMEHSTEWRSEPWFVKCYDNCNVVGDCVTIYPSDFE